MNASSVGLGGESDHSEVPGLYRLRDVATAHFPPSHEIFRRDEDPAVGAGSAARATAQAVEVVRHGFQHGTETRARTRWTSAGENVCSGTMAKQYFCAHCDATFTPEEPSNKPRCPKCMRRGAVQSVEDTAAAEPMRRWMVIPAILLAVVGIGYAIYQQTQEVSLEPEPPLRPLQAPELAAYLEREPIDAGKYAGMFALPTEPRALPEDAQAAADAIHRRTSRWSLEQALSREVLSAEEVLAKVAVPGERERFYPIELATALCGVLRQSGTRAMVAEVSEFEGEQAPADPFGMLGYFVVAQYDGTTTEPIGYLDPWGARDPVSPLAPRVLRDTEVIGAALGIEALRVFTKSGDGSTALPMIEDALELDPLSPSLRVVHATILVESGGLPQALQELDAAEQLRSDGPRQLSTVQLIVAQAGLMQARGDALGSEAQFSEAKSKVADIIERWPRYARAHLTMATIHLGLDELERARLELETAQKLEPEAPMLWPVWAQYHLATDDPITATAKMTRAIELDPENWQLRVQAAGMFQRVGEDALARAQADEALRLVAPSRRPTLQAYLDDMMRRSRPSPGSGGSPSLELRDPSVGGPSEKPSTEGGPALILGDPSDLRLRDPDESLKLDLDD
jgi:Tfp pilus assembly protein PilF